MREVKREYTLTVYSVLEMDGGQVKELGKVVLEGNPNLMQARKKAMKVYPENNIFIGETYTETAVYKMPVEEFIQHAIKTVKEN